MSEKEPHVPPPADANLSPVEPNPEVVAPQFVNVERGGKAPATIDLPTDHVERTQSSEQS
jgi:hypothetical protein